MKDIKVVFMGTPEFSVPILEGLINNYDVIGVFSQPDKYVGRKKVLTKTPVKLLAEEHGIKVFQPSNIKTDYDDMIKLNPDIIITCAYGQIIPKQVLDIPRLGCINVHASLLPKLRGGAPIHKAIMTGLLETGITIMYMDVKMDSGDIITTRSIPILENDTYRTLHDKLRVVGKDLLLETLPSIIEGTNNRVKQDKELVTFGFNVTREEEKIDFNKNMVEIYNHVRGLNDVPYAYFLLDEKEVKVIEVTYNKIDTNLPNGSISNIYKNGFGVSCNDGEIIVTKLKPFGKNIMDARSYLNGINLEEFKEKVIK